MSTDFDLIKSAEIAILAMICAVVYVTADVFICFVHIKYLQFVLILFLFGNQILFKRYSIFQKISITIF